MSAGEALRASRLHNQVIPNVSQLEKSSTWQGREVPGFTEEVAKALESKGHKVEWVTSESSTPTACTCLDTDSLKATEVPRAPSRSTKAVCGKQSPTPESTIQEAASLCHSGL